MKKAYEIISEDLARTKIDCITLLQIAVKTINNTTSPNNLILTLLVFGAYLKMTSSDPSSPSIYQRAKAIKTAIKEVRKIHAKTQIRDDLNMRNGPNTLHLLDLPINNEVLV